MATANSVGATTFTTPTDREIRHDARLRRAAHGSSSRPGPIPSTCRTGCSARRAGPCPSARSTSARAGRGTSSGAMPTATRWRCAASIGRSSPPERLVSTESWGGDWPETLNTLVLTEEDGKTTVTCTVLYPSKEARDAALRTRDEGRRVPELRSSRRVPANDGMRPARGVSATRWWRWLGRGLALVRCSRPGRRRPEPHGPAAARPDLRRMSDPFPDVRRSATVAADAATDQATGSRPHRRRSTHVGIGDPARSSRFPARLSGRGGRNSAGRAWPSRRLGAAATIQEEADAFLAPVRPGLAAAARPPPTRPTGSRRPTSARPTPPPRSPGTSSSTDYVGAPEVIDTVRGCSTRRTRSTTRRVRQLEKVRLRAAKAPGTVPEVVKARAEAEAKQIGRAGRLRLPHPPRQARDPRVGQRHRPHPRRVARPRRAPRPLGGVQGRSAARSATASSGSATCGTRSPRRMGFDNFFALQVADYGMTVPEMLALCDGLIADMQAAATGSSTPGPGTRWRSATGPRSRATARSPPTGSPTDGARTGPAWSRASTWTRPFKGKPKEFVTEQAERFYVSLGFPGLPKSFWEKSDLYPADPKSGPEEEQPRQRLAHRPGRRRPQPDVDRARQPMVHHGAPRARAYLLLHQLLDARGAVPAPRAGRTAPSTRRSAT